MKTGASGHRPGKALLPHFARFAGAPLVGAIISFVTVPIVTRLVSPEEFGKAALFSVVQTVFGLVSLLGLDQSFVRYFNDTADRKALFWQAAALPLLCSLPLLAIVQAFGDKVAIWMFGRAEPLILLSFWLFFPSQIAGRFSLLAIRMEMRGSLYSALVIIGQLLNFVFLLLFILAGERSFKTIVWSTIVSNVLSSGLAVWFTREYWMSPPRFAREPVLRLVSYGFPLVPAALIAWAMASFDRIGLREWGDLVQVGVYSASYKLIAVLGIFQSAFTIAWTPLAFKWKDLADAPFRFRYVGELASSIMSIAFVILVVFRHLIALLLGPDYSNAEVVFIYLLFLPVLNTIGEVTGLGIAFANKSSYNIWLFGLAFAANAFGNVLLIPSLGARGAAIATATSYIGYFALRTLVSRRLWFRFSLKLYWGNTFASLGLLVFAETGPRILLWLAAATVVSLNIYYQIMRRKTWLEGMNEASTS